MFEILLDFLAVAAILFFIWWKLSSAPEGRKVAYWQQIIVEGNRFLDELKEAKMPFEVWAKFSNKKQDQTTKSMGFDPKVIDQFVELAEEFPEQHLLTPRRSKVYKEYRVTRQAIRRMPGASSFKVGPF